MKNIFISIVAFFISLPSYSYVLEAKPITEMLQLIKSTAFTHKEDGLVFGFNSILSCLYISPEFVILKNYCIPNKNYPAKGYTIISAKYGIIDLYQEDLNFAIKHDIQITVFSDVLKDYVNAPFTDSTIEDLNLIFEKLYNQNSPACWSTNFSYSNQVPEVNCTSNEVLKITDWAKETQTITVNDDSWAALFKAVETAINN